MVSDPVMLAHRFVYNAASISLILIDNDTIHN